MFRIFLVFVCVCASSRLFAQENDLKARVEEHVMDAPLHLERQIPSLWAWIVNSNYKEFAKLREIAVEEQMKIAREQMDGLEELKALGMTENDIRFDTMELALVNETRGRMVEMQDRFFAEQIGSLSEEKKDDVASRYLDDQLKVFGSRLLAEREISVLLFGKQLVDNEGRKKLASQLEEEGSKISEGVLDAQVKASNIKVDGVTLIERLTQTLEMMER